MKRPDRIVVDVGGTWTRVGLVHGRRLTILKKFPTAKSIQKEQRALRDVLAGIPKASLLVVGLPGLWKRGVLLHSVNLRGWVGGSLTVLGQRLAKKVLIINDATAAAIGETLLGAGKKYSRVGYLTISTGLGGSLVARYGSRLIIFPAEPGKIPLQKKVWAEDLLAGRSFASHGHGFVSAQKHRLMVRLLEIVAVLWKPEVIILGGGIMTAKRYDVHRLQKEMNKETIPMALVPRIMTAQGKDLSGIWGLLSYDPRHHQLVSS